MANIYDQLRARYAPPEYALFYEVANGTGVARRRYADAIAASLFPSRGLDFHGFEVKTARGDWLRELKDPTKSDTIAAYCDFWWLVAGDEKVADKNEIPRNWGLLVSKDGELRQVKRAERLKPKPLDRPFAMALFRRADEWVKRELENDDRVKEAYDKGHEAGVKQHISNIEDASYDLEKLKKKIAEFEETSGLTIDTWHVGNVGNAVKAFLNYRNQKNDVTEELDRVAGWIEETAKELRQQAITIREAKAQPVVAPAPTVAP